MGEATARRRSREVIDGSLSGHVEAIDVERLHLAVKALLDDGGAVVVVIDTSGISDFSPQVRVPGVPFLKALREAGVARLVAIAPSPMVRMMGSALALAAGLRIVFVEDKKAAEAAANGAAPGS
jgi:hypothetical protein